MINDDLNLNPEDMSNLFRFFRVPAPLYKKWKEYAEYYDLTMKEAMQELLHSIQMYKIPSYDSLKYIDIAVDSDCTQPKMYRQKLIKQFHFKYSPELLDEICVIQNQTGYKGQTIELNKEICARLDFALKLHRY